VEVEGPAPLDGVGGADGVVVAAIMSERIERGTRACRLTPVVPVDEEGRGLEKRSASVWCGSTSLVSQSSAALMIELDGGYGAGCRWGHRPTAAALMC